MNKINHYVFKNSISIDVEHGFTRIYSKVRSINDSQALSALLDQTNDSNFVWGDSAYSGFHFDWFLNAVGFQSQTKE